MSRRHVGRGVRPVMPRGSPVGVERLRSRSRSGDRRRAGAGAFEFFDGRLQIHGYFEEQIRASRPGLQLSGQPRPHAVVQRPQRSRSSTTSRPTAGARSTCSPATCALEVRYDCVWTRACGMFPSADAFGEPRRAPARLQDRRPPQRLSGQPEHREPDERARHQRRDRALHAARYKPFTTTGDPVSCDPTHDDLPSAYDQRRIRAARCVIDQIDGFTGLFAVAGANANLRGGRRRRRPIAFADGDHSARARLRAATTTRPTSTSAKQLDCKLRRAQDSRRRQRRDATS